MNKPFIKIEIVSDVVCPWCYIGKRRLENAIGQLSGAYNFDVSFTPFELNPAMPAEGRNQKEYLTAKFGGEARYRELTGHVTEVAASEGIIFNYDIQQKSPNTRNAHRVIRLAAQEGKQALVKEALMKAYFTEGVDLTRQEELVAVAVSCGMNAAMVTAMLNSHEGLAEVILSEQTSVQRGVSGVPFYIINDTYAISGAQPAEVFVKAFTEIAAEPAPAASCAADEAC